MFEDALAFFKRGLSRGRNIDV